MSNHSSEIESVESLTKRLFKKTMFGVAAWVAVVIAFFWFYGPRYSEGPGLLGRFFQ